MDSLWITTVICTMPRGFLVSRFIGWKQVYERRRNLNPSAWGERSGGGMGAELGVGGDWIIYLSPVILQCRRNWFPPAAGKEQEDPPAELTHIRNKPLQGSDQVVSVSRWIGALLARTPVFQNKILDIDNLWDFWYTYFGLWVIPALGFKATVDLSSLL